MHYSDHFQFLLYAQKKSINRFLCPCFFLNPYDYLHIPNIQDSLFHRQMLFAFLFSLDTSAVFVSFCVLNLVSQFGQNAAPSSTFVPHFWHNIWGSPFVSMLFYFLDTKQFVVENVSIQTRPFSPLCSFLLKFKISGSAISLCAVIPYCCKILFKKLVSFSEFPV